jgi:hypothetical protein
LGKAVGFAVFSELAPALPRYEPQSQPGGWRL